MEQIVNVTPIEEPYTRPDGSPGIALKGYRVELNCGHSYTGAPHFDYRPGWTVTCNTCREERRVAFQQRDRRSY